MIILSFIIALSLYFCLRHIFWHTGFIPAVYKYLGKTPNYEKYVTAYNLSYIYTAICLFFFTLCGWLVFRGIFTPMLKLTIGGLVWSGYLYYQSRKHK